MVVAVRTREKRNRRREIVGECDDAWLCDDPTTFDQHHPKCRVRDPSTREASCSLADESGCWCRKMTWVNCCPTTTSVWSHEERRSRRRSATDSRSSAFEYDSLEMCRVRYEIWDRTVDRRWPCDTRSSTEREESELLKCGAPLIFSA